MAMAAREQRALREEKTPKAEEAREDGREARRKKRRRESAEAKTHTLEQEIAALDAQIEENASDYEKLAPLLARKEEAENELLELYEELEE